MATIPANVADAPPIGTGAAASALPAATGSGVYLRLAAVARAVALLTLLTILGGGLRVWMISDASLGHAGDLRLFTQWSQGLAEDGLQGFYASGRFCDYPPLSVLMLKAVGHAALWASDGPPSAELLRTLVKVPACLADALIALLLFFEARRLIGPRAGIAAATLYWLNPVALYDAAFWGQVDAVYTAIVLLALLGVTRRGWESVGAASVAALLAKFQSIAFLPLILFETYRIGGWHAIGRFVLAGTATTAVILLPFAWTGTLDTVLQRAYVDVVGQYYDMAKGAYNLWHVVGDPQMADIAVPAPLLAIAAQGEIAVPADGHWLLAWNWRRISLALYALVVAVILSVYSLRPAPVTRYAAAGLLAFAFYLFPTEMHERYLFPAVALLAIWAVSARWRERAYWLLCALLLLNLAAILSPAQIAQFIGGMNLLLFGGLLVALWVGSARPAPDPASPAWDDPPATDIVRPGPRRLIPVFRGLTVAAVVGAVGAGAWVAHAARSAPPLNTPAGVTWLDTLTPVHVQQGWRAPQARRTVVGAQLQLDDTYYLRGIGAHAPATLTYDIPANTTRFAALVGIDAATDGAGSARVTVLLDGRMAWQSPRLEPGTAPAPVEVALADAAQLTIRIDDDGDGPRSDHVNIALARFE
jgi:Gpi18-like mannosyltransferase